MTASIVEFSEDSNKVTLGGTRYRAEDGDRGRCTGCEMRSRFSCRLVEETLRGVPAEEVKFGTSRCDHKTREDGRSIVWVLDV